MWGTPSRCKVSLMLEGAHLYILVFSPVDADSDGRNDAEHFGQHPLGGFNIRRDNRDALDVHKKIHRRKPRR